MFRCIIEVLCIDLGNVFGVIWETSVVSDTTSDTKGYEEVSKIGASNGVDNRQAFNVKALMSVRIEKSIWKERITD